MTRRIVRAAVQLALLLGLLFTAIFFLDARYRLLPTSIHNHLPAHHPGFIITDITLKTCSSINPLSSCSLNPSEWYRIEKDVYLGKGWLSKAYIHVKRRKEEELTAEDKAVRDVRISRLDPGASEKGTGQQKWESRPAGIWLKRSAEHQESDSKDVVTGVDVLFGADAVEPRLGWDIKDTPLSISSSGDSQEARLSIRGGRPGKVDRPALRVPKDGKFKILQVGDMHLSTGMGMCRDPEPAGYNGGRCDADPRTLEFIGRILDDEKPDLAVLTGDQVNGDSSPDTQSAIFKFAELFTKRRIPFATIFGNHDDEGSLSRQAMMSLIESLPYSLAESGPTEVDGVGNYAIEVLARGSSHHSALTIYFLDTHSYSPDERQFRGYDWLKPAQIDWFKKTASERKKIHQEYTHIHLDMAFIHIPLPEYAEVKNSRIGSWREGVTAPGFNSHFKDALVEQGIVAVSCGHDHVNDFCALSKTSSDKPELWMCYAGGSGFGGYGGYGGYHRRVRLFELDTNENRISTWKRLEYGDTAKRLDEQVIVAAGKVSEGG